MNNVGIRSLIACLLGMPFSYSLPVLSRALSESALPPDLPRSQPPSQFLSNWQSVPSREDAALESMHKDSL